jgi:hypothetical protein
MLPRNGLVRGATIAGFVIIFSMIPRADCRAQSPALVSHARNQIVLTADMRAIDAGLLRVARSTLERWGGTFHAYAAYVPDTIGPVRVNQIGPQSMPASRQPSAFRESLRQAVRNFARSDAPPRTIGIMTDSIAGPIEQAVDGADGPDLPRLAITELEDRSGRCVRIEREYKFLPEPKGDWGLGTVKFGAARITRCVRSGYWT